MATHLSEYAQLLLRWLHVLTAMAWVGQSLYLLMLEARERRAAPADRPAGLWTAHDGALYHTTPTVPDAPPPATVQHWLFPAAYTAWLSGFLLLCVMYLLHPSAYLLHADSTWPWVRQLSGWQASLLAVVWLIVGWVVYDRLCMRLEAARAHPWTQAMAAGALAVLAAWLATQLFPARTACLLTGALLATWMTANLAHWITPAQRRQLAARRTGRPIDPREARRQQQRAAHNACLALPIVFLMLAPHHALLYTGSQPWWRITLVMAAGAALQQYWIRRHGGRAPLRALGLALALLALLGWQTAPPHQPEGAENATTDARVHLIVETRCLQCHATRPGPQGLALAGGIRLETGQDLSRHGAAIRASVRSGRMPPANLTGLTDAERDELLRWRP